MSLQFRSWKNIGTLPREECCREVSGRCLGGSCANNDACRGKDNTRRGIVERYDRRDRRSQAAFHAEAGHLPGYSEEDILAICLDRGIDREQVIHLMGAGIALETIERAPDAAIQLALEG